ncbi:MAG: hypothetical protein KDA96_29260, partial [Planctomycetaceae bacterium]|nr:hypothetical protein [Planctomycetaceae bacterium]
GGLIPQMLKDGHDPAAIITEMYLRCFCRRPADEELQKLVALTAGQENPTEVLEDIFWSLLNSREFLFNH